MIYFISMFIFIRIYVIDILQLVILWYRILYFYTCLLCIYLINQVIYVLLRCLYIFDILVMSLLPLYLIFYLSIIVYVYLYVLSFIIILFYFYDYSIRVYIEPLVELIEKVILLLCRIENL